MRHWYLLAKELKRPAAPSGSGATLEFVAGGGPDWSEVTPRNVRTRLFVLGALEMLPLGGAIGLGSYFEPAVPYAGSAIGGAGLSILLCWLLRHQTPPTVIHAVPDLAKEIGRDEMSPKTGKDREG